MKNDRNYIILRNDHLIIESHKGITDLRDIKHVTTSIIKEPEFNYAYRYILDFRDAKLEMNTSEIEECGNLLSSKFLLTGLKKIAFLTSNPDQVFKTTLLTLNKNFKEIELRIFSTLDCALDWLEIDKNHNNLIYNQINEYKSIIA